MSKRGNYAELFAPGVNGIFAKEAEALQRAGYATDPNYAKNVVAVGTGPTMKKSIAFASKLYGKNTISSTTASVG